MRIKIIFSISLFIFVLTVNTVFAQKRDSVNVIIIGNGSVYQTKIGDTLYTGVRSTYTKQDTFKMKSNGMYKRNDTIFIKRNSVYKSSDSLFKRSKQAYRKSDSLYRIQQKKYAQQSFKTNQKYTLGVIKNKKADSLRVTANLERLTTDLQNLQVTGAIKYDKRQEKEISIEIATEKNTTVFIKNLNRKLIIKTTPEKTVRLVTTIFQNEASAGKDVDWERVLNIDFTKDKQTVTIQNSTTKTITASGESNLTLSYAQNSSAVTSVNIKSPLIIYIPTDAKLNIENSYHAIEIGNNVKQIKARLRNTNFKMMDADSADINNKYGEVKVGNLKNAAIDVVNCNFNSNDIDKLSINSKYSTVTFNKSDVIDIKSVSDDYNIGKVNDVQVNKSFGKMSIATLTSSIVMVGSSADINISAITPTVKLIQIDNKYADIKLPVNLLKNYTINTDGNNNRYFTPFEKTDEKNYSDTLKPFRQNITHTIGNLKKPHTLFTINCKSCVVDFR